MARLDLKICSISMGCETLRVPLPLLRPRFCTTYSWLSKLLKVPLAVLKRLDMLIIIYVDDKFIFGWTKKGFDQGHSILPSATFRVYSEFKKSVLQPCQQIEFLGLKGNSGHSKPNNDSFIKRDLKSFVEKNITISDKYLPSALNKEADWESRNNRDSLD